jgi:pimeloyl-ACP methyl ester carboxylesterase
VNDTATAVAAPEVRYARSGPVSIAYTVSGDGPVDVVFVPGWVSNVELVWHEPRQAAFLRQLARACRLIMFDKRGTGLSDPVPIDRPPSLEERMDDVRVVMDEVSSERAVLFGFSEGGSMSILFAATHPARVSGLMLWGTWCRQRVGHDFPLGWTREEGRRRFVQPIQRDGIVPLRWFAPSLAGDPDVQQWYTRYARHAASPGMAIALLRSIGALDVRHVLPSVRVPTVVLHRTDDVLVEVGQGRYLAEHIPGARLVEFAGADHWPWIGDGQAVLDEMRSFLDRIDAPPEAPEHQLATVLAIAGAPVSQDLVRHHRGVLVSAGGTLARFDGPSRAVRCALDLVAQAPDARAGLHTGEVTITGRQVHGLAATLAEAIRDRAAPGTVLVSRTVSDLTAGSGLTFALTDEHVRDSDQRTWPLLAVT